MSLLTLRYCNYVKMKLGRSRTQSRSFTLHYVPHKSTLSSIRMRDISTASHSQLSPTGSAYFLGWDGTYHICRHQWSLSWLSVIMIWWTEIAAGPSVRQASPTGICPARVLLSSCLSALFTHPPPVPSAAQIPRHRRPDSAQLNPPLLLGASQPCWSTATQLKGDLGAFPQVL